jgi:Glycosyl transferases group 1
MSPHGAALPCRPQTLTVHGLVGRHVPHRVGHSTHRPHTAQWFAAGQRWAGGLDVRDRLDAQALLGIGTDSRARPDSRGWCNPGAVSAILGRHTGVACQLDLRWRRGRRDVVDAPAVCAGCGGGCSVARHRWDGRLLRGNQADPQPAPSGLHDGGESPRAEPRFVRRDGTPGIVANPATVIEEDPLPPAAPLVVQVSRWDRLKDPVGVLSAFARGRNLMPHGTHLVLAGPSTAAVEDDPEGAAAFDEVRESWSRLTRPDRQAIHLVCTADHDLDENSAIVNALQRRADVIVQKSLAEGFGLTVAEAMWKHRSVVASRVGGLQDPDPRRGDGATRRPKRPRRLCRIGGGTPRRQADSPRHGTGGQSSSLRELPPPAPFRQRGGAQRASFRPVVPPSVPR